MWCKDWLVISWGRKQRQCNAFGFLGNFRKEIGAFICDAACEIKQFFNVFLCSPHQNLTSGPGRNSGELMIVRSGWGSLMLVGREGWPVQSHPRYELLLPKLLKLMLVLIKRCAFQFSVYGAAKLQTSQGAHADVHHQQCANSGHVSIRTGPRNNGRWSGLKNCIVLHHVRSANLEEMFWVAPRQQNKEPSKTTTKSLQWYLRWLLDCFMRKQ